MSESEDEAAPRPIALARGLALIFDLDGVIIDSMPVHALAWQRYLNELGISGVDVEDRMHGRRNDEIVRDFLGPDLDAYTVFEHGAAKERLFREMMRYQINNRLVPGAEAFLQRVSQIPLALATNAERANADFVLDQAGLRPVFKVIVDGSQVAHAKPAPDVYQLAASLLHVAPVNCIVFEDSPVGVAAARAAGTRVVGILSHSKPLAHVDISVPDFLSPALEPWLTASDYGAPPPSGQRFGAGFHFPGTGGVTHRARSLSDLRGGSGCGARRSCLRAYSGGRHLLSSPSRHHGPWADPARRPQHLRGFRTG
jgi:beta-phosphoglucomutase family hydrolase